MREKVSILLTSQPNYDEYAFKYFILYLNKIQNYYEFSFPEIQETFFDDSYYDADKLFNLFGEKKSAINFGGNPDFMINIITASFGEDLFSEPRENIVFITTDTWGKYYSPPSLF